MKEDGHYSSLAETVRDSLQINRALQNPSEKKGTMKSLCVTRRLEMNASLLFLHYSHFLEEVINCGSREKE